MSNEPSQYKIDQALDLISSLNSGVIVKLVEIKNNGLTTDRIYDNNLNPLISLIQNTNFNTVELDRIVEAANKLTDGIYHPKAEFDAGYDLRTRVIEDANEKVAIAANDLQLNQTMKLGVNDDYKEFIQTNINKAFRDNISNYAHAIIMNDVIDHMDFLNKKGAKQGLSVDEIQAQQEKFMTSLKSGEFGFSAEEKNEKLKKAINKYSLFTEGQSTKDPKSLAKDIVHSIDGFMTDIYSRRKERAIESANLGFEIEESHEYKRPRAKM